MNGSSPEYREMGDRLRAARTTRRLTLRALGDRLGVSASLISQVERGLAKPSVNTLYAMARELDISLDELLFVDARAARPADDGRRAWAASGGTADLGPRPPRDPVQRADSRKTIRQTVT